ncbi:MAG: hypothetical protein HUU01_04220 [Saprospiraceae bacterium]|nr:hypothetical protein [Saprospiraceae bacterium]
MKKQLLLVILLGCLHNLFGQYVAIKEIDQSGNIRILNKLREPIDVNSQLSIQINRNVLLNDVGQKISSNGDPKINALLEILRTYKGLIEKMKSSIDQYQEVFKRNSTLEQQKDAVRTVSKDALAILNIFPEDSESGKRLEQAFKENELKSRRKDVFEVILSFLIAEMHTQEGRLHELLKESGFYFQLAAWISTDQGTKPVHLEGFDTLTQGEFYSYERNRLYLSPAQLEEFKQLNAFFETLDRSNAFNRFSELLLDHLSKVIDIDSIQIRINDLREEIKDMESTAISQKDMLIKRLDTLVEKIKLLDQTLKNLKQKYFVADGIASAGSKLEVLYEFEQDLIGLKNQLEEIGKITKTIITPDDIKKLGEAAKNVEKSLELLTSDVTESLKRLEERSVKAYKMAIYGREINTAALEVSKKVYKLTLDKIPESTMLDLNFTGKREPGDLIVIRAMLWKGDGKSPIQTETHSFPMMNALAHLHMSVAYAFAKPVAKGKNFEGGPLVSILYKFKSHNLAYRNFLDIGIGLHSAAYDFNNDDTPEFAGGVITSVFKDYLQFGWGFNFNAKQGYWFTGLRIPIQSTPVSLVSTANQ